MAQFDLHLIQNVAASGVEFTERMVNLAKGSILSADANGVPTVLPAGADTYMLVADSTTTTGLKFVAVSGGHTQNTDTGTTGSTFDIDSDGTTNGVRLKAATGVMQLRNLADNADADLTAKDLTLSGNLTVNGTTTTLNSTTLQIDDKNIELGTVDTPTDITADGGGITLKGTTDKTIIWDDANDNWTLNQSVNIPTGLTYKINNVSVLSATEVLGKAIANIVEWVTAPAAKNSTGTAKQAAFDDNYLYVCTATDTWKRSAIATNW
jgi:hypothetical protein